MLTCKNIVVINGEKGAYQAIPYDRNYLQFAPTDETEYFGKNNNKKPVELDGKIWSGTRPKDNHTKDATPDAVAPLLQDAMNFLVEKYGQSSDFKDLPAETKGYLILLSAADYGYDLWVRAGLQADNRPKAAQDPAVAKSKFIKQMIADAAANGKTLTEEKALARYERMKQMEAEEEAA